MNPTTFTFSSPDHNAFYGDDVPKVTHYLIVATTVGGNPESPTAQQSFLKEDVEPGEGSNYRLPLTSIMNQLPNDFAGELFVKAQGSKGDGPFGTSTPFLKGTLPAACNGVSVQ